MNNGTTKSKSKYDETNEEWDPKKGTKQILKWHRRQTSKQRKTKWNGNKTKPRGTSHLFGTPHCNPGFRIPSPRRPQ